MKVNCTSFGIPRDGRDSEDAFGVRAWDETVIAVVADGVGAARNCKEASSRIVESLISNYAARPSSWSPQKALVEFTRLINRTLYHESLTRHGYPEMASTLSVAVVEGNRLYGLNVGDSRIYLSSSGGLSLLSEDHVDAKMQNALLRAIGLEAEVEPHCFERELSDGDIAFLCSDGVSNVLSEEELGSRLGKGFAARAIVQHARSVAEEEKLDDMSAIVIEIAQTGKLKAECQLPLTIPETLRKGEVVEGYELIRAFQHSERVWLSRKNGQEWTIKFAPLEARDNEAILNQFVKETWNATRLKASYFVEAFVPPDATTRCYVMEFVDAPSLRGFLKARTLAIDEAIALGTFLLEACRFLLRHDLVHGDIKPENILVLGDYLSLQFKLIDFGTAPEIFSITSRAGTSSYLAPERFQGAAISECTEIFAIGVTLYQALTGVFPYGEIERFQSPVFHPPESPLRHNSNLPQWLESVILRMISIDPERRYRHYSEVEFDLANPTKVEPFIRPGLPLLQSNPLLFYKVGFYILLAITLFLLFRILTS